MKIGCWHWWSQSLLIQWYTRTIWCCPWLFWWSFLPSEFQSIYLGNSVCCHHQLFIFPVLSCMYYIAECTIRAAASLNNKPYKKKNYPHEHHTVKINHLYVCMYVCMCTYTHLHKLASIYTHICEWGKKVKNVCAYNLRSCFILADESCGVFSRV